MSEPTIPRKAYTSDLNDAQWDLLSPFVSANTGRGAKNKHPLREIINAILYLNVNGCKWADLPGDFPPTTPVSYHYTKWARNGTWRRINAGGWASAAVRPGRRVRADPQPVGVERT